MITKYSLCLVRRVNIGTIPRKGVMLQILPVLSYKKGIRGNNKIADSYLERNKPIRQYRLL